MLKYSHYFPENKMHWARLFALLMLATAFGLILSCNQLSIKKAVSENVLARAGDRYLYESDVANLVVPGTSAEDSLKIVKNYINNWVRHQLVVQKAEENLSDDQKSFEKQLREYRNSLVVYHYQTKLLQQELDTLIRRKEIEQYYEQNKSNFELKDHIVKVAFCKMLNDSSRQIGHLRQLLKADSLDIESFEKYSAAHAVEFFYSIDQWMYFSNLQLIVPLQTFDEEHFLRNSNYIEIKDAPILYQIRFYDFKIKEGISPLSLERENIKNIILNKRKLQLIEKMQEDVFNEAMLNNEIEIF